jgi:hypothetical protein
MARTFQIDAPADAKAAADHWVQVGEQLRQTGQSDLAFEAFRRAYGALDTAQKGPVRIHKGRELMDMAVASLDGGLQRETVRYALLAFLEDCISRAEDSEDVQDELGWQAAGMLRRFGLPEAFLLAVSNRTRRKSLDHVIKNPLDVFVEEGLDRLLATIPVRAPGPAAGRVNILVSSPMDLRPERILVADIAADLRVATGRDVRALLWEGAGARHRESAPPFPASLTGQSAQAVIDDRLRDGLGGYQIYVGMIWRRMGTPTNGYRSGTEAELAYALKRYEQTGLPHLLFYEKALRRSDARQAGVDDFLAEVTARMGNPQRFRSSRDLRPMLVGHLAERLRLLP